MTKILSRADIAEAQDITTVHEDVPEWGGEVILAVLRGTEREEFEQVCMKKTNGPNKDVRGLKVQLLQQCMVGEDGEVLFTIEQAGEVLAEKNGAVLDRLFNAATKLNGIGKAEIEELEKN